MKFKWILAIVIIFGLIAMFFAFQWSGVLKVTLIASCVILVGVVLLQSGKGGGLAAIGGFSDQSAFGTKTGTVLGKITYLIGAAFIFTTILLTKLTLTSMHGTGVVSERPHEMLQQVPHEAHDDHEGHDHEGHDHEGHDHEGHDHSSHSNAQPEEAGGIVIDEQSMGMKGVGTTGEKKEVNNEVMKGVEEEK
ncbi:MAG: preprotein translocase subunit SecG [Candidatus Scalindua sp.]|nr:preprotein translocase subunit SecG [Candidatus Scalindua sp.]